MVGKSAKTNPLGKSTLPTKKKKKKSKVKLPAKKLSYRGGNGGNEVKFCFFKLWEKKGGHKKMIMWGKKVVREKGETWGGEPQGGMDDSKVTSEKKWGGKLEQDVVPDWGHADKFIVTPSQVQGGDV